MGILRRDLRTAALAVSVIVAGTILLIPGWLEPFRPVEFSVLTLASMLIAAASAQHPAAQRRGTMTPSYVLEFCTLLLFGPGPASLASFAGALVSGELGGRTRVERTHGALVEAVTVTLAMQAAGITNTSHSAVRAAISLAGQALPIVGAAIVFALFRAASAQVASPPDRTPKARIPRGRAASCWKCPRISSAPRSPRGSRKSSTTAPGKSCWLPRCRCSLPIGRSVRSTGGLEQVHRRQRSDRQPPRHGSHRSPRRIALWNDALERMLNCRRDRALGLSLAKALPSLTSTTLPAAIADTLKDRTERTLPPVRVANGGETVLLEIRIVPVDDGVTLLCQDVTARVRAEQTLRSTTNRLALAAEGANEGWWEWDVCSESLHVSTRWKAMLGLSDAAEIARGRRLDQPGPS